MISPGSTGQHHRLLAAAQRGLDAGLLPPDRHRHAGRRTRPRPAYPIAFQSCFCSPIGQLRVGSSPGWARRMSSWCTKNSRVFSALSSGGMPAAPSAADRPGPARPGRRSPRRRSSCIRRSVRIASGGSRMPGRAERDRRSRTTRWTTSSLTVQSPHRVGASADQRAVSQRRWRSDCATSTPPADARGRTGSGVRPPAHIQRAECPDPHVELHPLCRTPPHRRRPQIDAVAGPRAARARPPSCARVPRARGRDPARAVGLHALHPWQRAVRRAHRRRRVGPRLGHRPRRAARVRHRRDHRSASRWP